MKITGKKINVGNTFVEKNACPTIASKIYHCDNIYKEWNIEIHRRKITIFIRGKSNEKISFPVTKGLVNGNMILLKISKDLPEFNTNKLQMIKSSLNKNFDIDGDSVSLCNSIALEIKRTSLAHIFRADCEKSLIELFSVEKSQIECLFDTYRQYVLKCKPSTNFDVPGETNMSMDSASFYGGVGVQPLVLKKIHALKPSGKKHVWTPEPILVHDEVFFNKSSHPSTNGNETKIIDISMEDIELPYFESSIKTPKASKTDYSGNGQPKTTHEKHLKYVKNVLSRGSASVPKKRLSVKPSSIFDPATPSKQSPKLSFTVNDNLKYQDLFKKKSMKTKEQLAANPIEISDDDVIEAKPTDPTNKYKDFQQEIFQSPRGQRSSSRIAKKDSMAYVPEYSLVTLPEFIRNYNLDDVICVRMGVQLKKDDVMRLDSAEFLNDQIILYFIKHYESEHPNPQVHIFSSFFYYKLQQLLKSKSELRPLLKWHKRIDIFKFPIIIIPINESFHWYFIVITNIQELRKAVLEHKEGDLAYIATRIIIVDSLNKHSRPAMKANILKYLEFLLDKPREIVAPYVEMKLGYSPTQPNGCDCGIFVIYGIKMILENIGIVDKMLKKERETWWDTLLERQVMLTLITDHHDIYEKEHGHSQRKKKKLEADGDSDEIMCIDEKYTKKTEEDDFMILDQ